MLCSSSSHRGGYDEVVGTISESLSLLSKLTADALDVILSAGVCVCVSTCLCSC